MKKELIIVLLLIVFTASSCGNNTNSASQRIDSALIAKAYYLIHSIDTEVLRKNGNAYIKDYLKPNAIHTHKIIYPPNYSSPVDAGSVKDKTLYTRLDGSQLTDDNHDAYLLFDAQLLKAFINAYSPKDIRFTIVNDVKNSYVTILIAGSDASGGLIHFSNYTEGTLVPSYFEHCMPCPTCDK
jgi:hypothetical protein